MLVDIEKSFLTLSPNWAHLSDIIYRPVLKESPVTIVISCR